MLDSTPNPTQEYVHIPLNLYESVLQELEQCRKALNDCQHSPGFAMPNNRVCVGRDPVTFRYEAWFKQT